jgi:16S rRNA processing protein RimM
VPARPEDLIIVGEVTRAHGVQGAVRVVPVTDFPERLLVLHEAVLVRRGAARPMRVEAAQRDGAGVLMKFAGIDTPDAAEEWKGATVQIPASQAVPIPPGQFYVFEVVGLEVCTPEGTRVGEVVDVIRTGSNDVYVIRPPDGPEILLPAVDSYVHKIDVAAGRLIARLPEWMT